MGRLHFMGTPIISTQKDATSKQQAFLQYALVEYIDEERDFQIMLHGGKSTRKPRGGVREHARKRLKDPRKLKRKK